MFCCVQYGAGSSDGNFFNVNCRTAAFIDFVAEHAIASLTDALERQREGQRKGIAFLTRQITAHTRHLQALQRRQERKGLEEDPQLLSEQGAPDEQGQEDGAESSQNPRDSPERVTAWIAAAEEEIREREAALIQLEDYGVLVGKITEIDLQDPETGQFLELSKFPVHMPASAVLPLRSSTVLYGFCDGTEPQSLVLQVPQIEVSIAVEEMITKGVLRKRQA